MCMQHAPCPSCVWLHVTQSDLVFNHLLHMNYWETPMLRQGPAAAAAAAV